MMGCFLYLLTASPQDINKNYDSEHKKITITDNSTKSWSNKKLKDYSNIEVNYSFINHSMLEVNITNLGGGGYKFGGAICNLSELSSIEKFEYNPATEVWSSTGNLNYDNLVFYGLNSTWCPENKGYGHILFSSGSKDQRVRLNFSNGDKLFNFLFGDGTQENQFYYGDSKILEVTLDNNTYVCGQDCYAIKTFTLYENGSLIQDLIYNTLQEDGSWIEQPIRNSKLSYFTGGTQIQVEDYEIQCKDQINHINCSIVLVGNHLENAPEWTPFEVGDEFVGSREGINYKVKHEGKKRPSRTIDWIIQSQGVWFNEWAIWGNISEGDEAEIIINGPANESTSQNNLENFSCIANVTGGAFLSNVSLVGNFNGTWQSTNISYPKGTTEITLGSNSTEISSTTPSLTLEKTIQLESSFVTTIENNICTETSNTYYFWRIYYTDATTNDTLTRSAPLHHCPSNEWLAVSYTNNFPDKPVDKVELYSWFNSASFYSGEKDSVVKGYNASNYTNQTFQKSITQDTLWTCQACDTDGVCAFANENRTILINSPPTILINSPTGTISTNNVTINFTLTDDLNNFSYCSYNVTTPGLGIVVADNEINCTNPIEYPTISDGIDYIINIFANDTSGFSNTTSGIFSVSNNPYNITWNNPSNWQVSMNYQEVVYNTWKLNNTYSSTLTNCIPNVYGPLGDYASFSNSLFNLSVDQDIDIITTISKPIVGSYASNVSVTCNLSESLTETTFNNPTFTFSVSATTIGTSGGGGGSSDSPACNLNIIRPTGTINFQGRAGDKTNKVNFIIENSGDNEGTFDFSLSEELKKDCELKTNKATINGHSTFTNYIECMFTPGPYSGKIIIESDVVDCDSSILVSVNESGLGIMMSWFTSLINGDDISFFGWSIPGYFLFIFLIFGVILLALLIKFGKILWKK